MMVMMMVLILILKRKIGKYRREEQLEMLSIIESCFLFELD